VGPANSFEALSDDEDDYLDTCPIYHDVDQQSIYGFEIMQHPLKKSDEILWKDRELDICFWGRSVASIFVSVNYKFVPPKPLPIEHTQSVVQLRPRAGSADLTGTTELEHLKTLSLPVRTKRWFESGSVVSVNLGSSVKIFHEEEHRGMSRIPSRIRMFEASHGRRPSMMKMKLSQRRNTVG